MSTDITDPKTMKGKGAFVTGGARGIGKAIVEALLAKGARVVFCDVNETNGQTTETELQNQYSADDVIFLQCDITDENQFKDTWQQAVTKLGAVDVCVNNAGIVNETQWEKCIAVNEIACIRGSMLAYEHMRKDKDGHGGVIINVASNLGLRKNVPAVPVYIATKHAVVAYTVTISCDANMSSRGVRWGVLCPGLVDTLILQMTEEQILASLQEMKESMSNRPLQSPGDVAAAFMSLLEDDDSNGDVMKVLKDKNGEILRQVFANDSPEDPELCTLIEKSRTTVAGIPTTTG